MVGFIGGASGSSGTVGCAIVEARVVGSSRRVFLDSLLLVGWFLYQEEVRD